MAHIKLDVYNYKRQKLCCLYDSSLEAKGQPHDITFTDSITGQKTLSFTLPYVIDERRNFRWNYIKSEYLIRLRIDDWTDWFIIHAPKKLRDARSISNTVSCDHISSIQKTKNLYLSFDDENGIGNLPYLLEQILKGTGWALGECDTMYERDGKTEKVRSLKSDGKDGAFQLITDVCNLFYAYPVFDGETKTVNIYSINNKGPLFEMTMGRDIDSITVEYDSDDIITRLYVEGEYGEFGYVGIDDINPTGLPYLMNFDYYKSIGLFTDVHQAALDQYYIDIKNATDTIKEVANSVIEKENRQNTLWGQIDYIAYELTNGKLGNYIIGGTVEEDLRSISTGSKITILSNDGQYRTLTVPEDTSSLFSDSDTYVVKFITLPTAQIGAKEVAIEAKEKLIKTLETRLANETNESRRNSIQVEIAKYESEIEELYNGNEATDGLYSMMHEAVVLGFEIKELYGQQQEAAIAQDNIEADFAIAMDGLLKEGYWNDSNYALGQEESLYADALDMIEIMSKPEVRYNVMMKSQANQFKYKPGDLKVNMKIRLYDPELGVNDVVYISDVSRVLDKPYEDVVTLSNEDIRLTGQTLDSILSRMTRLADLIDQKNSLYNRAEAISPNGSIYVDRLEGTINILKSQLISSTSSWYTDNNGNLVFESTNGKNAMMLTGDGFMLASGKNADGEWDWRTFGTGEGFTADAITTGYLSADRIEARAITADKLAANVGESLDLSSNVSIKTAVEDEMNNMYSTIVQTAEDVSITFSKDLDKKIGNVESDLKNYQDNVSTYIRFSEDGMTLGKESSNIQAVLENDRLSFVQDYTEVAYVSDHKLYVPEANITKKISIGNVSNGYFDFVTTPTGIAIIWRN